MISLMRIRDGQARAASGNDELMYVTHNEMRLGIVNRRAKVAQARAIAVNLQEKNQRLKEQLDRVQCRANLLRRSNTSSSDTSTDVVRSDEIDEVANQGDEDSAMTESLRNNRKFKDYPLPTGTARLGNARKSWWNKGKSLSQTTAHMLDRLFTLEELVSSGSFGGPEEGSWPRLHPRNMNAILSE
ncbi:hypothetical protein QAD02_002159 [Eretmocerus hayati]|uniref:Uncharacterized protein n=1 Tax=Eretmocerus hayati TaxID=131215 RepID=A0ACC2NI40_9HYME|nr:hypothetical protein QAD02_002159 [Eretmocerus hayati]